MEIRLILPRNITTETIGRAILDMKTIGQDDNLVCLDFSETEFLDTEGMNYFALLPYYIETLLNKEVVVMLPNSPNVLSFMDHTGLLKLIFDNFRVYNFSCLEDVMFLLKRYKKSRYQFVRIGLVSQSTFQTFLKEELNNVERLLNSQLLGDDLCACFIELSRNIFDHSGETVGGFSFHFKNGSHGPNTQKLNVTISDIGLGIKSTISSRLSLKSSENDSLFISEALREGITGTGKEGRGKGLALVKDLMEEVQITSGLGQVTTREGIIRESRSIQNPLQGTSITLRINLQ